MHRCFHCHSDSFFSHLAEKRKVQRRRTEGPLWVYVLYELFKNCTVRILFFKLNYYKLLIMNHGQKTDCIKLTGAGVWSTVSCQSFIPSYRGDYTHTQPIRVTCHFPHWFVPWKNGVGNTRLQRQRLIWHAAPWAVTSVSHTPEPPVGPQVSSTSPLARQQVLPTRCPSCQTVGGGEQKYARVNESNIATKKNPVSCCTEHIDSMLF